MDIYLKFFVRMYALRLKKKHYCLTAQGNSQTKSSTNLLYKENKFYMFNADFWEVLQTLPIGYTSILEKENRRKNCYRKWLDC